MSGGLADQPLHIAYPGTIQELYELSRSHGCQLVTPFLVFGKIQIIPCLLWFNSSLQSSGEGTSGN